MKKLIDEYYPEYCHSLEAVYGDGMMSEGGAKAIDSMFHQLSIHKKKALDIGSGLGGVATYLAKNYEMDVTGLEINPWMIEESKRRIPPELQDLLRYQLSTDNNHLPFESESFDIVYSKGVLCHLEEKVGLFKECYRILKPKGHLVILDWLSPVSGKWGKNIQRLMELEGLSLYAETVEGYLEQLREAHFSEIETEDYTKQYAEYNEDIVKALRNEKKDSFLAAFNEKLHKEAIEGYGSVAKAMHTGEGLEILFQAHKH